MRVKSELWLVECEKCCKGKFYYLYDMVITLRVLEMNEKWTKLIYSATNTRSRMETPKLIEQIESGVLTVSNAAMFPLLGGTDEEE